MKLKESIFALMVHGGILLAILCLVSFSSCQDPPPPPREPDPVGDFFDDLQDGLDDSAADTITVIGVDDNSGSKPDLKRQVYQEIITQLHILDSVEILEYPQPDLDNKFIEMEINLADGISPEDAVSLAEFLGAGSLLYASIESDAPDVHIKVYSADNGNIIFAETLQGWPLPITEEEETFDILGGIGEAEVDDAESSGTPGDGEVEGE
ncbi:hypothetical protein KAU08_12125 [bacterium]|nr:hypothetical protein [bacterium]